jgi:ATP-dependent DNA ligase
VVGWTDPEGSRPWLGALLLAYYHSDGRLVYTGRAGTGIDYAELERLWRRLQPLVMAEMPLDVPPPRDSRFGSPLTLSRVHWVRPEFVVEVKFLSWTEDNLLRQVVYEGLRENKPPAEVRPAGEESWVGAHRPCFQAQSVNFGSPCLRSRAPQSNKIAPRSHFARLPAHGKHCCSR